MPPRKRCSAAQSSSSHAGFRKSTSTKPVEEPQPTSRYLQAVCREQTEQDTFQVLSPENSSPCESTEFSPVDSDREPEEFDLLATSASTVPDSTTQTPVTTGSSPALNHQHRPATSLPPAPRHDQVRKDLSVITSNGHRAAKSSTPPTSKSPTSRQRTDPTEPINNATRSHSRSPSMQHSLTGIPQHSAARAAARASSRAPSSPVRGQQSMASLRSKPQSSSTSSRTSNGNVSPTRFPTLSQREQSHSLLPDALDPQDYARVSGSFGQQQVHRKPLRPAKERTVAPSSGSRLAPASASHALQRQDTPIQINALHPVSNTRLGNGRKQPPVATIDPSTGWSDNPGAASTTATTEGADHQRSSRLAIGSIAEEGVDASSVLSPYIYARSSSVLSHGSSGLGDVRLWRDRSSSFGGSLIAPGLRLLMEQMVCMLIPFLSTVSCSVQVVCPRTLLHQLVS
jgi:hypothetical protein